MELTGESQETASLASSSISLLCNFLRFLLSFCYIYEIPTTPCSEFNTPAPGQGTREPGANIPGNTTEEWPGWRAGTWLRCLSLSHPHVHMRHTQRPAGSHVQGPRSTPASSVWAAVQVIGGSGLAVLVRDWCVPPSGTLTTPTPNTNPFLPQGFTPPLPSPALTYTAHGRHPRSGDRPLYRPLHTEMQALCTTGHKHC